MSTVALQLVDVLREFGVNTVFGIPGGTVAAIYEAMMERPDLRIVTAKHETGAVFMAMGYARATGRPGVVLTIAGPGITNALTGLASAFYEGEPVILISGEVARSSFGRNALQEGSDSGLDSVSMVRRMTKFATQISRSGSAAAILRKALNTAYSGRRGPAFVSLPLDVANEPAPQQTIVGSVRSTFEIDPNKCREALESLAAAQRPLILVGAGGRDATSRRSIRRLAEHLGSPVAVTTKGKGVFPEDHPLYLGISGSGGHDSLTNYLTQGVDVLFACGTGLSDIATNGWSPLLKATRAFIQCDIDAAQLGRNYAIDLGLLGPIDAVVGRMLEHRLQRPIRRAIEWDGPAYQPIAPSTTGQLTPPELVQTLNRCCPASSVFTLDIGEHSLPVLHYLRVREGGDFIHSVGFASMGSSIGSAIGYQFGAPGRRTFAICGDGGFLMYGTELATAVQHGIPTTFVVMNDSRLNMVHHGLNTLYGRTADFSTQVIDFAALARAQGASGEIIETREQLAAALELPLQGPRVLDARIDPEWRMSANARVASLKQFTVRHGA